MPTHRSPRSLRAADCSARTSSTATATSGRRRPPRSRSRWCAKPTPEMATLLGGGWIASGPPAADRMPQLAWPQGLKYVAREAAGEVQSPLAGPAAAKLAGGGQGLAAPHQSRASSASTSIRSRWSMMESSSTPWRRIGVRGRPSCDRSAGAPRGRPGAAPGAAVAQLESLGAGLPRVRGARGIRRTGRRDSRVRTRSRPDRQADRRRPQLHGDRRDRRGAARHLRDRRSARCGWQPRHARRWHQPVPAARPPRGPRSRAREHG